MLAGAHPAARGEAFLIAGDEAPTLNQIAASVADSMGVRRPQLHLPVWPIYAAAVFCVAVCMRLGFEPPLHRRRVGFFTHHREFDIAKARRLLSYEPRIPLGEGLRRTAAWYAAAGLLAPLKARIELAMSLAMVVII
ncbi:MAG TPA: hypothetical protein VFL30_04050, partial [Rhodanobacteraceae bacterium]|nr:hypothetical protein [Rhodanobacteraceae bacterium]